MKIKIVKRNTEVLCDLTGYYYAGMGKDGAPNITAKRAHAVLVSPVVARDIMSRFPRCNFRASKARGV